MSKEKKFSFSSGWPVLYVRASATGSVNLPSSPDDSGIAKTPSEVSLSSAHTLSPQKEDEGVLQGDVM